MDELILAELKAYQGGLPRVTQSYQSTSRNKHPYEVGKATRGLNLDELFLVELKASQGALPKVTQVQTNEEKKIPINYSAYEVGKATTR